MPFDYAHYGEDVAAVLRGNSRRLDGRVAEGLRPPPRMTVADWAAEYRRFPDDDAFPGKWRHTTAPYLVEIMEALSPHDPCEEVIIKKCAQSGGSASAENWIGFISDVAPGPLLFVQATLKAALDWAGEKLWPMIQATPRLDPARGGTIRAQGQADGDGSNKHKIKFSRSNGYVLLAGANSAPSLRQRTVRYAVEDDLDQFPDDLDGQGSPEVMVDNRLKVYRRQGLSKRLKISTPTIKGASKIGAAYEASDRRRYYLKCPGCSWRFHPIWSDVIWPEDQPEDAYLQAPCCGSVVEHWQKAGVSLTDGWLSDEIEGEKTPRFLSEEDFQAVRARMPASRKRGFHIVGEISTFQTWADMATGFLACRGDLNKLKSWTNLDRGEEFEVKGSTPDHEKLKELREQDWGAGEFPHGPVCSTAGVDVQGDGLYYEIVLWGQNAESWSYRVGFITGHTDVPGEGAWADLEKLLTRPIEYPGGKGYPIDFICVDGGYHTAAAEAFCSGRPNRLVVFGRAGWTLPVLGRGENIRYERQGKHTGKATKRSEDKAYLVGTYGVKLTLMGYLRATIQAAADELAAGVERVANIRGRCHFNRDAPDQWFEQLTAETIVVTTVKRKSDPGPGFSKREWKPLPGRENHWLDCRVYNHAAAEKLMLDTLTEADWAQLRAERYAAKDPSQGDLLAYAARPVPTSPVAPQPETPPAETGGYIDAGENYL